MSKRRYKCSDVDLSEFVTEYLKAAKYEKCQKLFQCQINSLSKPKKSSNHLFSKFRRFLRKRNEKIQIDDDLGFEINFGTFQSGSKVTFSFETLHLKQLIRLVRPCYDRNRDFGS